MFKKFVVIILVFALICTMLIGCAKKDEETSETTSTTTEGTTSGSVKTEATTTEATTTEATTTEATTTDKYPLIVKDESVTLTVATFGYPYGGKEFGQDYAVFDEIERRTGVIINWDITPLDQYQVVMQTRLAAGKGSLPDILYVPGKTRNDTIKYAKAGLFAPLNDLIENSAPNLKSYFVENPSKKGLLTADDGIMYSIPDDVSGGAYINPFIWMYRKDWLETLSLNEPTTIEECYNVLKAFKTQDPNKNGIEDEIPLGLYGSNGNKLTVFAYAWDLNLFYSSGFSVDDNNKVQYDYISPRYKEFIIWCKKLYDEGLIYQEFTSDPSGTQLLANIALDRIGAAPAFLSSTGAWSDKVEVADGLPEAEFTAFIPLKGPYAQKMEVRGPLSGDFAISVDCNEQEVAIKWIDFIFASKEGMDLQMYGIEGLTYTRDSNGQVQFKDVIKNNPDGLSIIEALRTFGAWSHLPYIQTLEAYKIVFGDSPKILEQQAKIDPYLRPSFPGMIGTEIEVALIQKISPDLTTYIDEKFVKYIIGAEDLESFDEYVAKIEEIGIKDILMVKQAQYDRFVEANK